MTVLVVVTVAVFVLPTAKGKNLREWRDSLCRSLQAQFQRADVSSVRTAV